MCESFRHPSTADFADNVAKCQNYQSNCQYIWHFCEINILNPQSDNRSKMPKNPNLWISVLPNDDVAFHKNNQILTI